MKASKRRLPTRNQIAMIEERIMHIQTDINRLQQNLINNMIHLHALRWKENVHILKTAYDNLPARTKRNVSHRVHAV